MGGGKKSKKVSVVQYKVRWEGYSKDDDSWVDAYQITPACIAAFNGEETSGKGPTSLLATIPTAKHPSSPGYAAFKNLMDWSEGTMAIKGGNSGPGKRDRGASSLKTVGGGASSSSSALSSSSASSSSASSSTRQQKPLVPRLPNMAPPVLIVSVNLPRLDSLPTAKPLCEENPTEGASPKRSLIATALTLFRSKELELGCVVEQQRVVKK